MSRSEEEKYLLNQLNTSEQITIPEGEVDVVTVIPKKPKTTIPVVVAPGWLSSATTFQENILTLAKEGRSVISFRNFHGVSALKTSPHREPQLQKVVALIQTLEKKGIDKVDVIAHSQGGLYVTIAATLYPKKFRNIVFVNPAGIVKQSSIKDLAVGFTTDILRQIVTSIGAENRREAMWRSFSESAQEIQSYPLQIMEEVLQITKADLSDMLKKLKEKGIGIAVIHGVHDQLFSYDEMKDLIGEEDVHVFNPVWGGHNDIYLEAERYTKIAEGILTELEDRE